MDDPQPLPEVKEPSTRILVLHWFRRLVPSLDVERRARVQVKLRDESRPDFGYFLLVALSSLIATSGLITDSAAVIIGAMLVAPLMSPILGISLASITGDGRLARDAGSALLRGMVFAVGVAWFLPWLAQILPFNPIANPAELPGEVLARTNPSPFDLGVAVAGGLAAAFALAQPSISAALPGVAIATALMPPLCTVGIGLALSDGRIAGGALLLFLTNLAAIAFAGVLTFFALGFRPQGQNNLQRGVPRSLTVSATLVALLVIPLAYVSATFLSQGREGIQIREIVRNILADRHAELISVDYSFDGDVLDLEVAARSSYGFFYEDVVELQDDLGVSLLDTDLNFSSLSLSLTVIPSSRLDPRIPPTFTPTPTLGPTPTSTITHTPTSTSTQIPTSTSSPEPTSTPTQTPTPSLLVVSNTDGRGLQLRTEPFGADLARMREGTQLIMLYGYQIEGGLVWIEVMDPDGRIGWVPQFYTYLITLTPSPTLSPTPTSSVIPSPETVGTEVMSPTPNP